MNRDHLMPEDQPSVNHYADADRAADEADARNDGRWADSHATMTFTRSQLSHLLALTLQFAIVERRDTVARRVNEGLMKRFDAELGRVPPTVKGAT